MGAFQKSWRNAILIKAGEHVNEMMAVAANFFDGQVFLPGKTLTWSPKAKQFFLL